MRKLNCAVLIAMMVGTGAAGRAFGAPAATSPPVYGAPHQLVEVSPSRRINVFCMGTGSPTVVFSAGAASWSYVWAGVQPAVARRTRTCSWDRAGNGFSDPSPEPQDIDHIVGDLERALSGAGVTGPLVLVGHSQGGLESLAFADRLPDRLAGLVLVDPAFPDQAERLRRAAPTLMAWSEAGDRTYFEGVRSCIAKLGGARSADALPDDCARYPRSLPGSFREALRPWDRQPAYWQTYLSDYVERDRNAKLAINAKRNYGDTPLVVFGSGMLKLPGAPERVVQEIPALQAEITRGQLGLAGLSTAGLYQAVPDSGHAIMLEKPDLVVTAILRIIDQAQAQH